MNILLFALVVGVLFASGTFLILRRSPIRLVLGLALLSHGVNLLLFSTSTPLGGMPPIIADKAAFDGNVGNMVDPLPQALILTAIVISFGVTAFTVVLINRRNSLSQPVSDSNDFVPSVQVIDPFAPPDYYVSGLDQEPDDYEWLEYSMVSEYRSAMERRQQGSDGSTLALSAEDEQTDAVASTDGATPHAGEDSAQDINGEMPDTEPLHNDERTHS